MEKKIRNLKEYKNNKTIQHLNNELLPKYEMFVAFCEEYIFKGDFSVNALEIRSFCLVNYLRMIFCEAEYRLTKNDLSADELNKLYKKLNSQMKTFRKDIRKIMELNND